MNEIEELKSFELVLAYFWSELCVSCKHAEQFVDKLSTFYQQLKVVKINMLSNLDLATLYEIQVLPTFLIFKNGKIVERIVGFKSGQHDIEKRIRKVIF